MPVEQMLSTILTLVCLLSDPCPYHEVVIESNGAVARTVLLSLLELWLNADLALLETWHTTPAAVGDELSCPELLCSALQRPEVRNLNVLVGCTSSRRS
jgi:hypothetical protein